MRQKILLLSTLAFVALTTFGCPRQDIKISGFIKSVDTYEGIASAKVVLGDKSATTDDKGFYTLTLPKRYKNKVLKVSVDGFISYQKSLKTSSGKEIVADAFLKPTDLTEVIDPTVPNVITTRDGAEVSLPVLEGITEKLKVSLTNYHVSTDDIQTISGDFSAIDAEGNETDIYSMGMINVDITGEDTGDYYSLEGKGTFTIKIPVTNNTETLPATIPLWFFDVQKNKWVEQGQATLHSSKTYYEGTVTHFSTWNTDTKFDERTNVSGKIVDPSPAAGEVYEISVRFDGFYRTFTQSDSDFTLLNLPQGKQLTIEVKKRSTTEVWGKVIAPINTATYDAGNFPDGEYYSTVLNLAIKKAKNQFTLNWTDPVQTGFEEVRIEYNLIGELPQTVIIPKGTQTRTLNGLIPGEYSFTITALYAGGKSSQGITKFTFVYPNDTYILDIELIGNFGGGDVLVNGVEYKDPLDFAPGTKVILKAEGDDGDYFYRWEGDGIDDSNRYTNPLEFTMDGDKSIIAVFEEPS